MQANQLNWLTDVYYNRFTRHVCSDYIVLTAANQSGEWLIDLYADKFTMQVRSDYV